MVSDWCESKFGASADEVLSGVVRACILAQESASDAQAGSRLRSNEPFGATFWVALGENAAPELASVPGFSKKRPKGSRFDIPSINGTTILATKCASNAGPERDRLKVRWSAFRDDQLKDVERPADAVLALDEWIEEEPPLTRPDAPTNSAVLIVVVASAEGGLQRIYIGDGYLEDDGRVRWIYCEAVPLEASAPVTAVSVPEARPRFDEAPMRDLDLGMHEVDEHGETAL